MPSNHLILFVPFSSYLQSFPASGSFPMTQFFACSGQNTAVSASSSVLLLRECSLLSSVSSQQRFEVMDIKALSVSQLSDSPGYSSQTDQFYLENKGKYILKAWGHADPKGVKRTERDRQTQTCVHVGERDPSAPWLLPLYTFFPPPGPALCKLH